LYQALSDGKDTNDLPHLMAYLKEECWARRLAIGTAEREKKLVAKNTQTMTGTS
jgi:hypothetical protein